MDNGIWKELYRDVGKIRPHDTLVGFNVNLDRILQVSTPFLDSLLLQQPDLSDLRSRLLESMRYCTAGEWFITDPDQYRCFTNAFAESGTLELGGQAGIAALHLAGLGCGKVFCIAPVHGASSAAILEKAGVRVPDFSHATGTRTDYTHLVFEYPCGIVPMAPGVVPRNNRFIISPLHEPEASLVPASAMDVILEETGSCDRAFLSGYQYLRTDREFLQLHHGMQSMKNGNPDLRIHMECVSAADRTVIGGFIRHIVPAADSLGMNEHELLTLLRFLGISPVLSPEGILSPSQNMAGALSLCHTLGLVRLHVHTFGYYIEVILRNQSDAGASRDALLNAARVVAQASRGTSMQVSPDGVRAVEIASREYSPAGISGVFLAGPYYLIVVPTLIAADVTKTTGLGDILSVTAFVADNF